MIQQPDCHENIADYKNQVTYGKIQYYMIEHNIMCYNVLSIVSVWGKIECLKDNLCWSKTNIWKISYSLQYFLKIIIVPF